MKIYLTTSLTHKENIQKYIEKIVNYSKELGHDITQRSSVTEVENQKLALMGGNKAINQIKVSDIVIAELSNASSSVGFEIALASFEKKPTLVLIHNENKTQAAALAQSTNSKYISIKNYSRIDELEHILKYFFQSAKEKIDTKFILIIPPEIDRYLEWNTREKGIPKAEITRNAIEAMMSEDRKYQEYLKGIYAE